VNEADAERDRALPKSKGWARKTWVPLASSLFGVPPLPPPQGLGFREEEGLGFRVPPCLVSLLFLLLYQYCFGSSV
jgi:hypothetical protein